MKNVLKYSIIKKESKDKGVLLVAEKFYLTTAIAYTSSKPHIGNVYEAILADAIVRYKRKKGFDVYFQTGTDEHGQKIQMKAEKNNMTPKQHVDRISDEIKRIYALVDVCYDRFIRTTDPDHIKEVAQVFEKLYRKGDIYKGSYEGNYCVDCESFFTAKDLVDGCCPDCGAKVQLMKEEAYFLKLAPYQQRLIDYIHTHPDFIQPESRKNEMLHNFWLRHYPICVCPEHPILGGFRFRLIPNTLLTYGSMRCSTI